MRHEPWAPNVMGSRQSRSSAARLAISRMQPASTTMAKPTGSIEAHGGHALETHDDLATLRRRHRGPDETRQAPLRNDRQPQVMASPHHGREILDGPGPHHGERQAVVVARPIPGIGLERLGRGHEEIGRKPLDQAVEHRRAHRLVITRHRRILAHGRGAPVVPLIGERQ